MAFESLSTTELQTALTAAQAGYASAMAGGLASYSIDGRSVTRRDTSAILRDINELSNEIARRAQSPDRTEISYGGFADPAGSDRSWMSR